jgi:hypothetical protein
LQTMEQTTTRRVESSQLRRKQPELGANPESIVLEPRLMSIKSG